MNKIDKLFNQANENLLNIFYTAGYPKLDSTVEIAQALAESGVKIIEIGMPYSDPLADGKTIQHSSETALKNGMNLDILFEQISTISKTTELTIILMGYLNQMMAIGEEKFLEQCQHSGVDGLIVPDLPMELYENEYQSLFQKHNISISFLVSPRTSAARIVEADRLSSGFIYIVADNSITGKEQGEFNQSQLAYFERIASMKLNTPVMIGFGIKSKNQFTQAGNYANGAIIGSEFIRQLPKDGTDLNSIVKTFVSKFLTNR